MERKKERKHVGQKREPVKDWSQEGGILGRGGGHTCLLAGARVCHNSVMCRAAAVFRWLYQWKITHGCFSVMGPAPLSLSPGVAGEKYGVMQHCKRNKPMTSTSVSTIWVIYLD